MAWFGGEKKVHWESLRQTRSSMASDGTEW
jgi:hypothetical protein